LSHLIVVGLFNSVVAGCEGAVVTGQQWVVAVCRWWHDCGYCSVGGGMAMVANVGRMK